MPIVPGDDSKHNETRSSNVVKIHEPAVYINLSILGSDASAVELVRVAETITVAAAIYGVERHRYFRPRGSASAVGGIRRLQSGTSWVQSRLNGADNLSVGCICKAYLPIWFMKN